MITLINHILWDYFLLFSLLGTGLMFSLRLKFLQIYTLPKTIVNIIRNCRHANPKEQNGISSFQALTTAIAAQVGTGNLAGAATAIVSGGPGAIFWMWVSAFLGMGTIYAESVLAQKYRKKTGAEYFGGPAFYIQDGLNMPILAKIFAASTILALGCIGSMVQANSISHAFNHAFTIPHFITGCVLSILLLSVIQGGIKRIASFCEWLVPTMAVLYLVSCFYVLSMRAEWIIPAIQSIITSAFTTTSVAGGIAGIGVREAMRYGISRGLFSNEAGMGSTPHAHAAANVAKPSDQGEVAIFSVFFDTFFVLTLTALVILTSSTYLHMIQQSQGHWITSIELTQAAFRDVLNLQGESLIAIVLLFFAFSTILGWYYFAEINVRYLFNHRFVSVFQWLVASCIIFGTLIKVDLIWELADTFNGLMCLPNLIALWLLRNQVISTSKNNL